MLRTRTCAVALATGVLLIAAPLAAGQRAAAPNGERPCTITGTPGNDVLRGTKGDDVICGEGGADRLYGGGGGDVLRGGPGRDFLDGQAGDDTLEGGSGRDIVMDDGDDHVQRDRDDFVKLVGDGQVTGNATFSNMEGDNVTTTQGSPTNCTRDEQYDTFRVPNGDYSRTYAMTTRNGGSCGVESSINTWVVTINGAYAGMIKMQLAWNSGFPTGYYLRCEDDAGWKNLWGCQDVTNDGWSVRIYRKH